jgi:hypothetical protein
MRHGELDGDVAGHTTDDCTNGARP